MTTIGSAAPRGRGATWRTLLVGLTAALAAVACNKGGGSPPSQSPPTSDDGPVVATAAVGPAGGTLRELHGAELVVPPGALASTVVLTLARDSTSAPQFPPPGQAVRAAGAAFALGPHGTTFGSPVKVRVPFDPASVPTDAEPTLYKAEPEGAFTTIPTTVAGGVLEADVTDLSWVIAGYTPPRPRRVYALTADGLSAFRIDPATGALSGPTSSAATGGAPNSVLVHPSGRFAYVTNGFDATSAVPAYAIATYQLDGTSGAIHGPTSTVASSSSQYPAYPATGAFHPSGKFLYVVNYGLAGTSTDVSRFAIDLGTGALTGPLSVADSGGAPPTGIAFSPSGRYAYVTYSWRSDTPVDVTAARSHRVAVFSVDAATGALGGPLGSAPTGEYPWSVAVHPTGQWVYVSSLGNVYSGTDPLAVYAVSAADGGLTRIGELPIHGPASLSMDTYGRFLHVGKQRAQPGNVQSLAIGASGLLSAAGEAITGPGSLAGQIAAAADPQGEFLYAFDQNGTMTGFRISAAGALTPAGSVSGIVKPRLQGLGLPFSFGVTGTSPIWRAACTVGCSTAPGAAYGTTGSNPAAGGSQVGPSVHYLGVSTGAWRGRIVSTPDGIDYGLDGVPTPPNRPEATFPVGSIVQLCATRPSTPVRPFDIEWRGDCSGTSGCTSVVMDRDRSCHLELIPRL